jgi:hypothetical protein
MFGVEREHVVKLARLRSAIYEASPGTSGINICEAREGKKRNNDIKLSIDEH